MIYSIFIIIHNLNYCLITIIMCRGFNTIMGNNQFVLYTTRNKAIPSNSYMHYHRNTFDGSFFYQYRQVYNVRIFFTLKFIWTVRYKNNINSRQYSPLLNFSTTQVPEPASVPAPTRRREVAALCLHLPLSASTISTTSPLALLIPLANAAFDCGGGPLLGSDEFFFFFSSGHYYQLIMFNTGDIILSIDSFCIKNLLRSYLLCAGNHLFFFVACS